MINSTSHQLDPRLDELTQHLANERFTPGRFQQVRAGDFVVTFRPADEDDEQLLLVQCKDLPAERLAGTLVDLTPTGPEGRPHRGWLDRRGCTFVAGLTPGAYRLEFALRPQEQRLPEPSHQPAETPFDAASEVLLVQPIELSQGRLYWVPRPDCLILLWQSTRPGAVGSARVLPAGTDTSGDAPLLIPVAAKHQVVPWPTKPGEPVGDVRLQFEGTADTVLVSAAWFESGSRYLAAALYDMHVPTLAQTIERLEAGVRRQTKEMAETDLSDRVTRRVQPRSVDTGRPDISAAEQASNYGLSESPTGDVPTLSASQPDPWKTTPVPAWTLGAKSDDAPPPGLLAMDSITLDGPDVWLRCRPELAPYFVGLVVALEVSGSQRRLGQQLVVLRRYQGASGEYLAGSVPLRGLLPDADLTAQDVTPRMIAATPSSLVTFCDYLAEIARWLQSPEGDADPERKHKVEELANQLKALSQRREQAPT